jgi:hypothetical protein
MARKSQDKPLDNSPSIPGLGKEGYYTASFIKLATIRRAISPRRFPRSDPLGFISTVTVGSASRRFPGRCARMHESVTPYLMYPRTCAAAAGKLPPTRWVPDITDVVVMRILVRHGLSRHMAELLIADLRRCLEYFETHPVSHPMTASDGGTYNHDVVRS